MKLGRRRGGEGKGTFVGINIIRNFWFHLNLSSTKAPRNPGPREKIVCEGPMYPEVRLSTFVDNLVVDRIKEPGSVF